jgi:hypothetical protein
MKHFGVSARAKAAIVEALYRWAGPSEELTEGRLKDLCEIADAIVQKLDSAGYVIEMKPPPDRDIHAIDIGEQALKVRRAEMLVKEWVIKQSDAGIISSAQEAPAWRDYQRENDLFIAVVAAADARAQLAPLPEHPPSSDSSASSDQDDDIDQSASPDPTDSFDETGALPHEAELPHQVADPIHADSHQTAT